MHRWLDDELDADELGSPLPYRCDHCGQRSTSRTGDGYCGTCDRERCCVCHRWDNEAALVELPDEVATRLRTNVVCEECAEEMTESMGAERCPRRE